MATELRFESPLINAVGGQAVYWKERWQEAWVLVPELWASETTWSCAPSISTAQLRLRYGDELNRSESAWRVTLRQRERLRHYVRIDHTVGPINGTHSSPLVKRWYGVLEVEMDQLDGLFEHVVEEEALPRVRGKNHFTAYGLESLLDQDQLSHSVVAGTIGTVARALTFNPRRDKLTLNPHGPTLETHAGNRASTAGAGGVYVFHDQKTGGGLWSTKQIAEYLLKHATPRDTNGEALLEWELADVNEVVPNWDQPELIQQGRKPHELLRSLFARQRLLSFYVQVEETEGGGGEITNGAISIVPFTFNAEDIHLDALSEGATIPANGDQVLLVLDADRGAQPVLKRSSADAYDQVIAQGDRRTSTATWSYLDNTLAIGWSGALETAFEAAASGEGDYPGPTEIDARCLANIRARSLDKFKACYQRHIIVDPFQGQVGDGTSGELLEVLLPSDDDDTEPDPHAPEDLRFLTELPLLAGYDYSDNAVADHDATETGPAPHKPLEPIVLFPWAGQTGSPGDKKYRHAERTPGQLATTLDERDDWAAGVRVEDDDGALWLDVQGGWPQDQIGGTDFAGQAEDIEPRADFREMLVTAAVPWSRYAEGRYPADEDLPAGIDCVRRLRIEAGANYKCDYVVPQTVVSIDAGGNLVRSNGGFVRDDREQLAALAQIAFAWYGQTRTALVFSTSLVNAALQLGMLVVSIGDPELDGDEHIDAVNSVVTEIRLLTPLAEGRGLLTAPIPTIFYETSFGELDVLKVK